jgi:APA family basic amino acid/polyamine antiporter
MHLKPVLGQFQLVMYSIGVIIGAGVYSVIGVAAGMAGESLWVSFVIGAVVAALTGISYAEMATAFPVAGAEYVYVRRAIPTQDWIAFAVAFVILIGGAAASTTVAMAFGGYLRVFADIPAWLAALALLAICTALNIIGLRAASWFNVLFTLIEVAGLLLVVAAGMTQPRFADPLLSPPQPGVLGAAAILFFVYLGFEEVANLAEEAHDPARNLPRAIFISLSITTLLYVLVALAAVALAPGAELAKSAAPLALAVQNVWPGAVRALSAIALFATANTVLVTLIATSRIAFSMARDGDIPRMFAAVLPERKTPWTAVLLTFAIAAVLLPIGDLKLLAELSSFAALIAYMTVNVTLVVLRHRLPGHPRPFRVPWSIGRTPVLPVLGIAAILVLLFSFDWQIYAAGGIALVVTAAALLARRLIAAEERA